MSKLNNNCVFVCFYNCRFLRKYIDDFRIDIYLKYVDILVLCEIRVFELDLDFNIEGFFLFCVD